MRTAKLERKTNETNIALSLNIDGRGKYEISTGVRFFDHMLELFARHGAFDLRLAQGGPRVEPTTELAGVLNQSWSCRVPGWP